MTHIMVDLETLSTEPNAAIIAIGAVKFSAEEGIYAKYYQAVASPPLDELVPMVGDGDGFHISADTLEWWKQQSDEAKTVFRDPNAQTIKSALANFKAWALHETELDEIRVWGNGASFDNVILSTAYKMVGVDQPWKFYNDRCYRTIKNVAVNKREIVRKGTHHNALDDAESQAEHLLAMNVRLA